ncbi:hypothetical protein OG369_37720 [Streptomyces sp. NBC_01221]|uniref:hypothetical protein n=1 Tax=Streptomyces sp. NBC_01221 TaxID=2903782 RepID=UPI002258C21D|nr:hypothetical protein [Streptomyces sp. NBC_01221]MCX4791627.1 hypothetical protein [Streptomyces sp. NBC_01221]
MIEIRKAVAAWDDLLVEAMAALDKGLEVDPAEFNQDVRLAREAARAALYDALHEGIAIATSRRTSRDIPPVDSTAPRNRSMPPVTHGVPEEDLVLFDAFNTATDAVREAMRHPPLSPLEAQEDQEECSAGRASAGRIARVQASDAVGVAGYERQRLSHALMEFIATTVKIDFVHGTRAAEHPSGPEDVGE